MAGIPIEEITNLFHAADADHNGILSYDELASIMTAISSGNRPPDQVIQQCYEAMDVNKNGEIDEQEFTNVIVNWLNKQSEVQQSQNKKRNNGQVAESLSPNLRQRKKMMTNITNFFRQFTPILNYEEEQKRILRNNPLSNLNLLTIHREYLQYPSQEKLEKYEMIKTILQNGRDVLIQEINSFDWNVIITGIQKVQFILSIVELFSTPEERSPPLHSLPSFLSF
jgi:hypothetical protein